MSNFYGSFYINICGFISRDKSLYKIRVLVNSYLRFKVQLPTSDSTEITAGGPIFLKYSTGSCTPRRPLAEKLYGKHVHNHI